MGLFGKITSRLDELRRVLTKDPGSRQFLALADEYRKHGQVAEAIETLQKGLAASPGAVAGHVALGRLLAQSGRFDEAVESFEAALRLDRENLVALRQLAEIHLKRGDKVEAIKKLKLYRALSPGDREVNDLIQGLDEELGWSRPKAGPPAEARHARQPAVPPVPSSVVVPAAPPIPALAPPAAVPAESLPEDAGPAASLPPSPPSIPAATAPVPVVTSEPETAAPAAEAPALPPIGESPAATPVPRRELLEITYDGSFASRRATPSDTPAAPVGDAAAGDEAVPAAGGVVREAADAGGPGSEGAVAPPLVSEALADLYAAQGHFAEARDAYRSLAAREAEEAGAARLNEKAAEIERRVRDEGPADRLRRWAGAFERSRIASQTDLDTALGELMRRVDGVAAVSVTDLAGFTVVFAGDAAETPALEGLSAEMTAFWKNVRRTRGDVGEGALDRLVVTGEHGAVLVQGITSGYALLVKAAAGRPQGQLRFEALRTAERLRPALL